MTPLPGPRGAHDFIVNSELVASPAQGWESEMSKLVLFYFYLLDEDFNENTTYADWWIAPMMNNKTIN